MAPSSFGLNPDQTGQYKEVIYKEIFSLVQHCRIDYDTAWDMPVILRHWWFREVEKMREEQANAGKSSTGHVDPFGRHHK